MQKSFYHAVIRSCLVNWYQQATLVDQNYLWELGLITQRVTCTSETTGLKKKKKKHSIIVWDTYIRLSLCELWQPPWGSFAEKHAANPLSSPQLRPKHSQAAAVQRQHTKLKETRARGLNKKSNIFLNIKMSELTWKYRLNCRWLRGESVSMSRPQRYQLMVLLTPLFAHWMQRRERCCYSSWGVVADY